jgi:gluconolactonase
MESSVGDTTLLEKEDTMTTRQQPIGILKSCQITLGTVAILVNCVLPGSAQAPAGIPGVLAPGVVMELIQEGFTFTEGPVGTADGGLFFSDIRANRTYYLDPAGKISVVREPTNGANGLALTREGELVFAEGVAKRITKREKDGTITTLTQGVPGSPLLAPNDLILDAKGGVYFTDPGPGPFSFPPAPRPTGVYYLPAGAKIPVVIDKQNPVPNGLVLTNDGKTLIVNDTSSPVVWAFDVQPDGTANNKRSFTSLHDIPADKSSGADGMAIDRDDRVYVSTITGVQVFDARGHYLGTIALGRQPANVAFSGADKQTLYITAREALYRVKMLSKGPARLGK